MRKRYLAYSIAILALGPALMPACAARAQSMNARQVLDQMNASSARFHDVKADITVDLYTAIVQEHELQKGMTAFRRHDGSMEMVSHLDSSTGQPVAEILYKNGELDYYQPSVAQETIFSAASNRGEWDTLLATGFGATAQDLTSQWNVTFEGMETIDGHPTAKLDLVSKQANIRNNYFSHVTIWLDLSHDISLKQIFVQPDGDSKTVTYNHIRYNTRLPNSLFTLRVARGTQVTRK